MIEKRMEAHAQRAVSDLVDRLLATAKAELGPDYRIEQTEDGVAITGHRLALRRIADVRLRDLIGTAVHGVHGS